MEEAATLALASLTVDCCASHNRPRLASWRGGAGRRRRGYFKIYQAAIFKPWSVYLAVGVGIVTPPLAAANAQEANDDLRIYAVNVVKTPPFEKEFTGYGVYLGAGMVITAAHVVGNWPFLTHPRVLIAGQDLPAKIIKQGSFDSIDLALLSVDESALPLRLRLRRNPLCKVPPPSGAEVINVVPEGTSNTHIISAQAIAPELRTRFDALIDTPRSSGSGLFDVKNRCLVGIISAKVQKYRYVFENNHLQQIADGFAGYFVPAGKIASFIPSIFPRN